MPARQRQLWQVWAVECTNMSYFHVGEKTTIYEKSLIGIFDIERTTVGKDTRLFLRGEEDRGQIETDSEGIPRSMIVTEWNGKYRCLFSIVRPETVGVRAKKK